MDPVLLVDVLRYTIFGLFGVGAAFMVVTNVLAFSVLRPPKQLGFLWWHVMAISLSFLCLGAISVDAILIRVGNPFTWRVPLGIFGFGLFMVAQIIIFNVERNRFSQKKALEQIVHGDP